MKTTIHPRTQAYALVNAMEEAHQDYYRCLTSVQSEMPMRYEAGGTLEDLERQSKARIAEMGKRCKEPASAWHTAKSAVIDAIEAGITPGV